MKSDREHDGVFGAVRRVQTKTTVYPVSEGGGMSSSRLRVYNLEGRRVQDSFFQGDTAPVITTYEYDGKGNLTEAAEYNSDSLLRKIVYRYDARGRLIEWVQYGREGQVGRRGIYEDVNGIRVEKIIEGACAGKEVIAHDDMGNRTDLGVYPLEIAHSIVSIYDATANPTKVTFYDDRQLPLRELRLVYDSEQKLIEIADFCPSRLYLSDATERLDSSLSLYLKKTFTYKNRQKTEESTYNNDGSLVEKVIFVYDSEGRLSQKTERAANNGVNSQETYSRELDSAGNWIKETVVTLDIRTKTFSPAQVAERIIEYY